jgi:hypothetical protein
MSQVKLRSTAKDIGMSEEQLGSVYTMDRSLADAERPKPLPIGEYRGEVRGAELKTSSKGKPMLVIQYFIDPSQFPADYTDGNPDGETLSVFQSLVQTPRNRYLLKQFCLMHGVAPSNQIDTTAFIAQNVILAVSHEEYEGMEQARGKPVRAV